MTERIKPRMGRSIQHVIARLDEGRPLARFSELPCLLGTGTSLNATVVQMIFITIYFLPDEVKTWEKERENYSETISVH